MDRGLLARATSSDESPTPGYMFGEVAKMTLASVDACKAIEEYLLTRIQKKNANVKFKSLMLIKHSLSVATPHPKFMRRGPSGAADRPLFGKMALDPPRRHVSRTGSPAFRRDLCRQLGPIKECLQFSGPPDALRGDEMYRKVRDAAKEALDAVTSSEPIASANQSSVGGRIASYSSEGAYGGDGGGYGGNGGNSAYSNGQGGGYGGQGYGGPGGGGGGGRYEGYGNSPMPPQKPGTALGKMAAMATGLAESAATSVVAIAQSAGVDSRYVGGSERAVGDGMSGSRMGGVGNPAFADARLDKPTWSDQAASTARRAGNSVRNMAFKNDMSEDLSAVYASNRGANPYGGQRGNGSYERPTIPGGGGHDQWQQPPSDAYQSYSNAGGAAPPRHSEPEQSYHDRPRGDVGGGWGAPGAAPGNGYGASAGSASSSQQRAPPSYDQPRGGANGSVGRAGGANQDGEYERTLILDLCAAGGTRAVPPADKLATFVAAAPTLDPEVVGPNLLDLLADEQPWQARCKALAVVEALAIQPGCEAHRGYFAEVAQDLAYLCDQPPLAVQKQARRTLAALGHSGAAVTDGRRAARRAPADQDATFDAPATAAAPARPPAAAQANLLGDLFDDDDDNDDARPPQAPQAPPPQRTYLLGDLLGGDDEGGAPPQGGYAAPPQGFAPEARPQGGSLFANLDVGHAPAPARAPAPDAFGQPEPDLFGSLSVKTAAPAAAAAPVAKPAAIQPAAALVDPFDSLEVVSKPPPPPPATGPAFSPKQSQGAPAAVFAAPHGQPQQVYGQPQYGQPAYAPQQQTYAPQQLTPQQMQQQQMLYAQQMMYQQQMYAQQQRMMQQQGQPQYAYAPQPTAMMSGQAIPGLDDPGRSSGFSFMAPKKASDSFAFVSDLMAPPPR